MITHREVGVDTENWHAALKNTLRQAPDVILIGEIRDRETMEYGIQFAETGHLVLATLHANSSNQALDRIINFFPDERREQLLMDLSLNIRALVSQRLIPRESGSGRIAAMEIMLNSPLIQDLIFKGKVQEIKEVMSRSDAHRHEDLRPGAVRAVRDRVHLLRRRAAQCRLEERAAPQDQAREQARGQESRRRRRARHHRRRTNRAGRSSRLVDGPQFEKIQGGHASSERAIRGNRRGQGRGRRRADGVEHPAAVQAHGGAQGLGPVLHFELAHQGEDRRRDHAHQQADPDARNRAPGGLRPDDARPARELQARAGDRLRHLRARPRPLPRQRVLPARLSRDGAALHQRRHAQARRARAARRCSRTSS